MQAKERHTLIMKLLLRDGFIRINDIAKQFNVSNETSRRDLEALQDRKLVKRVHGGAVIASPGVNRVSQENRRTHSEKNTIARAAAELVHPGETIFIDTGTTNLLFARNLKQKNDITVLSNSLFVLNELAESGIKLFGLGGEINPDELFMYGQVTVDALNNFWADKAFIGAGGVTIEDGISDYFIEESLVKRTFIDRSSKVILLANSEKFGQNSFAIAYPLTRVDVIVSDDKMSPEYRERILDLDIELILVDSAAHEPPEP
jgi:DeoR/GlpR family transcriptional regulator of sugar metabolism